MTASGLRLVLGLVLLCTVPVASADVSVVTVGPGGGPESMFGHSGIRVERDGIDRFYTVIGDVDDPAGAVGFVLGESRFHWTSMRTSSAYDGFRADGREIREQRLLILDDEEARLVVALHDAIGQGDVPYRLLHGNCAGLVADLLVETLPGLALAPDPGRSVSEAAGPYMDDGPWMHLGLRLALGIHQDARAPWPLVPDDLHDALAAGRLGDGPAVEGRLVAEAAPGSPPAQIPPLLPGLGLLACAALSPFVPGKAGRRLAAFPVMAIGGLGTVLFWLALMPGGPVTLWNPVLLWAWPAHLAAPWLRGRAWRIHASVAAGAALVGLVASIVRDTTTPLSFALLVLALPAGLWAMERWAGASAWPTSLPTRR